MKDFGKTTLRYTLWCTLEEAFSAFIYVLFLPVAVVCLLLFIVSNSCKILNILLNKLYVKILQYTGLSKVKEIIAVKVETARKDILDNIQQ